MSDSVPPIRPSSDTYASTRPLLYLRLSELNFSDFSATDLGFVIGRAENIALASILAKAFLVCYPRLGRVDRRGIRCWRRWSSGRALAEIRLR